MESLKANTDRFGYSERIKKRNRKPKVQIREPIFNPYSDRTCIDLTKEEEENKDKFEGYDELTEIQELDKKLFLEFNNSFLTNEELELSDEYNDTSFSNQETLNILILYKSAAEGLVMIGDINNSSSYKQL